MNNADKFLELLHGLRAARKAVLEIIADKQSADTSRRTAFAALLQIDGAIKAIED